MISSPVLDQLVFSLRRAAKSYPDADSAIKDLRSAESNLARVLNDIVQAADEADLAASLERRDVAIGEMIEVLQATRRMLRQSAL